MRNDEPLWRDPSAATARVECCAMRVWYSAWGRDGQLVRSLYLGGESDLAGGGRGGVGLRELGGGKNLPFSEGLILRDDPLLSHL